MDQVSKINNLEAPPERKTWLWPTVGLVILFALYLSSVYNYLLFHSISELFSVIVAVGIFMVAWNARQILDNRYFLFLGVAYLFVAALDLVHALAYTGMGVFPGYGANLPTQLWVATRYLESLTLLVAPLFIVRRKINPPLLFTVYGSLFALVLVSIFYWDIFPAAYVEGQGLTAFKVTSEYIISLFLLGGAFLLYLNRQELDKIVFHLLIASLILSAGSEMAFTLYADPFGFFNTLGHFLKIVSFYLIYRAIVVTGLQKPYKLLYRDLANYAHRLHAANQELEAFNYSVSHDLRAPLRSIKDFSRAVLEDYADKLDKKGTDYLKRIRAGSRNMSRLIDDLLRLSRLSRGELAVREFDISRLAENVAEKLKRREPDRNLIFNIMPDVTVKADKRLLEIALENLMANACKFTGDCEAAKIEFAKVPGSGHSTFYVKDNGVGFNMEYAGKLFAPFQRLHSAADYSGTGIGLAIVQRIIARHGGKVWAEGEEGRGATFYFTL